MDNFDEPLTNEDYLVRDCYSLEDIKKAFWLTFHKSGEVFFTWFNDKEADATTECVWEAFQDGLKSEISWEGIAKELGKRDWLQLELKLED